jgi:hypothetical protein
MQPLQVGRQGVIKDVKSIIADYRQKHPEVVPRRGRRMKHLTGRLSTDMMDGGNSRPSSNDSCNSNTLVTPTGLNINDVLAQFAKLSQSERQILGTSNLLANISNAAVDKSPVAAANTAAKPYPEVSLHPIQSNANTADAGNVKTNTTTSSSTSLLHGILMQTSPRPNPAVNNFNNAFPSTLARLLTGPERKPTSQHYMHQPTQPSEAINSSEITITPVMQKPHFFKNEQMGHMVS